MHWDFWPKVRQGALGVAVVANSELAFRRPGIAMVGGTAETRASSVISENSLMQAIADNPVSMASYARMQKAGGDIKFNFDLLSKSNAVGQTNPASRLIELDPLAIQAEARAFGYDPSTYAARVFTHEADHLIDIHRGVWSNTQFAEYKAYNMEYLFQNGIRPSLDTRRAIWDRVSQDYDHLPIGKNPFGN